MVEEQHASRLDEAILRRRQGGGLLKGTFLSLIIVLATFADPIKKREEFSISLRKKKKQEIIYSKRKRAEWNSNISPKKEDEN